MKITVGWQIASYLERNRSVMIQDWMEKVILDFDDPYKKFVATNGTLMLDLIIECASSQQVNEAAVRDLAHKVSLQRITANANIGDFVHNVTVGRSEILNHLPNIGVTLEELHPILTQINDLFDKFLYFAVRHYTDMTNQQLEEKSDFIERSHKDKMTILGQMSSSFVHEFRNPLTSVIGFVQLLRDKYPELEYIDVVTKELDELSFRITQFLLVSKKDTDYKQKIDFRLSDIVGETLEFLYPMIVNDNVGIEKDVDDSIKLNGYPDEFRQVLINIIMNSLHALASCPTKIICLKGYTEGQSLLLEIMNNGPPIPSGMLTTIFEPFVSTKELGTGIGLYVCRKIIMHHGGVIECESDSDWTTFRITIPIR